MEYMSSEDSSEGEDSGLQEGTWQLFADLTGRASAEEKVVEVKTPRWRSAQVRLARFDRFICPSNQS